MVETGLTHYMGVSIPKTPLLNVRSDRRVTLSCLQKVQRLCGGATRSFSFPIPPIID